MWQDEPALDPVPHQLIGCLQSQFLKNLAAVGADGFDAQSQVCRHLTGRAAGGKQSQDLELAVRQALMRGPAAADLVRERLRCGHRDVAFAAQHGLRGADDFLQTRPFADTAAGTCTKCARRNVLLRVQGAGQNRQLRIAFAEGFQRREGLLSRQAESQKQEVVVSLRQPGQSIRDGVALFRNDAEVILQDDPEAQA